MNKITFSELIKQVSGATNLSKQACHVVLRNLAETIEEGLVRDGQVRLKGLGTFRLRQVAQRQGINPRTGQPIIIPGHNKIVFHPSIDIKNQLNENLARIVPPLPKATEKPIKEMSGTRSLRDFWRTNKIIQYSSGAAALALVILIGSLWLGGGDKIEHDTASTAVVAPVDIPEPAEITATPEPQPEQQLVAPAIQVDVITSIEPPPVNIVAEDPIITHAIKSGDNLWALAKEYYGDPYLWPLIYEHNKDIIANPDMLLPGTNVHIPTLVGSVKELEKSDIDWLARANALVYQVYSQSNTPGAQDFLKVALKLDPGIAEKLGINKIPSDILVTQARE